tara:strand:- start:11540 stop:16318 length:4779 start_codon:yes stop_codon:yes gene_type:complete
MSARKYTYNINDEGNQAWKYRESNHVASADIISNETLKMTLVDGQEILASGKIGHFSATPGGSGNIFYSGGNVAIGPFQDPPTSLYVSSNSRAQLSVATYSNNPSGSKITIDNARGDSDNPQPVAINDISSLVFRNYQGTVFQNSSSIRSQLKGLNGEANLDFYVNGGTGEERAISVLSNKSIIMSGSGTDSGVTISDGLIEMRTANGSPAKIDLYCEVNNAHKITIAAPAHADFSGNVTFGLPGSNGSDGQALVTDGLGNTRWATASGISDADGDTKIQVEEGDNDEDKIRFDTNGSQRMIIDEAGNIGIGEENPVATLDVNGNIRAAEYGWGTVLPYFGSPRYKISELTDKLWNADIRFASDISNLKISSDGDLTQDEFDNLPFATDTTSWREPLKFIRGSNSQTEVGELSFDDSGDLPDVGLNTAYRVMIVEKGVGGAPDKFKVDLYRYYSYESAGGLPATHRATVMGRATNGVEITAGEIPIINDLNANNPIDYGVTMTFAKINGFEVGDTWWFSTRHLQNHKDLFNGAFAGGVELAHGEEHNFIIRWSETPGVSRAGMDYSAGKLYLVFHYIWTNFEEITVKGFYANGSKTNQIPYNDGYGEWTTLKTIASVDDPSNITYPVPGQAANNNPAIFEIDIPGDKINLQAIDVRIKVNELTQEQEVEHWNAMPAEARCRLSAITLYQERGSRTEFELPYFNKYDDKNTFYGSILHGDGSREYPSISFANKENSGLYFDPDEETANSVVIASGGNDAIAVDSSGDIVKLGQDVPAESEVLTWEGNKAVWSPIDEPASIKDSDGDTKIQVEEGDNDEDKIRFDTAGVERMIIDNLGSVGIGTDSPSEILHIASAGKAAIFVEADTNDSVETDTSYIKLSQDGGKVTSHLGFNSGNGKNPENEEYPGTLSNALLITNKNTVHDPAVQIGANNSVIATFKNGMVGIGKNNPSSMLDVNGEIAADSVIAGSVDVNGRLTFKELIFGAAQSYGGIAKYPIRELNDTLWRADIRSGHSIADTGSDRQIFYPKNNHGENVSTGTTQSILDKGADQVVPIIRDKALDDGPGPSDDIFIAETSWIDQDDHSLTVNSALPKVLFDGLWSNTQKLRPDFAHEFVINFMKHKNFSENGLSYGEGKFYIGFFGTAKNFAKIKLEAFYLQRGPGEIFINTGRWVECCDPITSPDDERNISISEYSCYFEMSISNASSEIRPIINQRNGEVMDATGARRRDYYLSALRVTVEAGSLPLGVDGDLVNFGGATGFAPQWLAEDNNTDWLETNMKRTSLNHRFGCWVADMAFLPTRRQEGFETSFFHKFEDMSTIPGGIYFGDGAAANPTVTFTSGDDYGIFYDSENSQMGLSGGGNEAITIDASGDVTKLGQDAPAQSEVLTWDGAKAVWSPNAALAQIEPQQIMIDFNVDTKPRSPDVSIVYPRNSGVGNIDGGSFTVQADIATQGNGAQVNFSRENDTTFETTLDQARNFFISGFVAHDSSLVRFQTITLPVHNWEGGIYVSIWRGTYTNLTNGNVVWNRVSLINVVNNEGNLEAGTISFDEDIIESNNSFNKGDLWSLIFWSDNVPTLPSSSKTWVTGNLFFEKN